MTPTTKERSQSNNRLLSHSLCDDAQLVPRQTYSCCESATTVVLVAGSGATVDALLTLLY
jgi:hypothetical protein